MVAAQAEPQDGTESARIVIIKDSGSHWTQFSANCRGSSDASDPLYHRGAPPPPYVCLDKSLKGESSAVSLSPPHTSFDECRQTGAIYPQAVASVVL